MFLHSEIELVEDSVTILLRWMETLGDAGAFGCLLLNPDRSVQTSCVRSFPTLRNQFFDSEYLRERFPDSSLWGQRVLHAKWPRQTEVDVISGVCLVRRSIFDQVGGFNEIFVEYGAEADLCFKLSAAGSPVYFVPETSVIHHGSREPSHSLGPAMTVRTRESVFQFMTLHYGAFHGWAFRASMTVTAIVRLLLIPPMMPMGKVVVRHGRDSWRKWAMILRWSLGRSCAFRGDSGKTV
jgi:GT2 family glycosyltransferase